MHTFMDTHLDMDMDDDWTQKVWMLILATSASDHQKNIKNNKNRKKTLTVIIALRLVEYWNDRIYYEMAFLYLFHHCSKITTV